MFVFLFLFIVWSDACPAEISFRCHQQEWTVARDKEQATVNDWPEGSCDVSTMHILNRMWRVTARQTGRQGIQTKWPDMY